MATATARFLPIMSYEDQAPTPPPSHPDFARDPSHSAAGAPQGAPGSGADPAPEAATGHQPQRPMQASQESVSTTAPQGPAAGPAAATGEPKTPARRPAKKLTPLELRSKAVFRALEKLLEKGLESEAQLWVTARILSGDEYQEVAEERHLAGLCGNPLCASPAPPPPAPCGGKYKIDLARHVVYSREGADMYCCAACGDAVRAFSARLGSQSQAQHRFELLMREAQQARQAQQEGAPLAPAPAAAAAQASKSMPPSALAPAAADAADSSGTSSEGSGRAPAAPAPAGSAQQCTAVLLPAGPAAASAGSCSGTTSSSCRSSLDRCESGILYPPGTIPSQWTAHRTTPPAKPAVPPRSAGQAAGVGAGAKPGGPKGVLKREGSPYAAGTAKTPIMLAEIKERDPSLVAAETARGLPVEMVHAAAAPHRAPSAASRSGPRAVEGYVPRAGKSQYKQLAAAAAAAQPPPQPQLRQGGEGMSAQGLGEGVSPQRRVRFSDEDGGSLEMPSAAELARAAATPPRPQGPGEAKQKGKADGESPDVVGHVVERPEGPPPMQLAAAAPGSHAGAAVAPAPAAEGAGAPVLVFNIEDPQGPLEAVGAAAGEAGDLATRFGRLCVVGDGGEAAAGADVTPSQEDVGNGQPLEQPQPPQHKPPAASAAAAHPLADPSLARPVEEILARQMQDSMRKLFPRLSTRLPADVDANLEAQLASDSDAESAGWSSSSEEEGLAGPASSDEEGEGQAPRRRSAYRMTLSFFGTLFTHLELWITDATLEHLATPPGTPATRPLPQPSLHSAQIHSALARFLASAVPAVAQQLCIGMPRGEVERSLAGLLDTMHFAAPLPPFKSSQWQLLVLILLKALSLERAPALRGAFESREGLHRLSKALGGLGFTIEEFYAVLELLVEGEEQGE